MAGLKSTRLLKEIAIISSIWILSVLIVNPVGNFPLNDDWSFGIAVQRLLQQGTFQPSGWTAMTLVTQTFWGAFFSAIFGFSFTTLRFSTLCISLLGIIVVFLLIRQTKCPRWLTFVVTLTLAFNPVYFALSFTFMTDIHFSTLAVLSSLLLLCSLQFESDFYLIGGTIVAVAAILCRQLGVFIPMAFGLCAIIKHGFSYRWLLRASFPVLMGFGIFLSYNSWMELYGLLPKLYVSEAKEFFDVIFDLRRLFRNIFYCSGASTLYLGLFLFPILIILFPNLFKKQKPVIKRLIVIFGLIFISSALVGLIILERKMPVGGNILTSSGIGPITVRDVYRLSLPHNVQIPSGFWMLITLASILGGFMLLTVFFLIVADLGSHLKFLKEDNERIVILYMIAGTIIYLFPIVVSHGFFDRYLLPIMPLLSCALVLFSKKHSKLSWSNLGKGITVLLGLLIVFSIATTRDYLTWNRTRWEALHYLKEQMNVPPSQIDGGLEFNGLCLYDNNYAASESKSWWWVEDDKYLITLGSVDGYEVVSKLPFRRLVPWKKQHIFILARKSKFIHSH